MTLIKSISGIRGTIGGISGDSLSPLDVLTLTAAYGALLRHKNPSNKLIVAIGRDGRNSGLLFLDLVANILQQMGFELIDLDLTTTPTIAYYIKAKFLDGGIIITASHNTAEWNALKFLDNQGEFLNQKDGQFIIEKSTQPLVFAKFLDWGKRIKDKNAMDLHIQAILKLPYIKKILTKKYKIVVDGINSSGSIFVPALLRALGITEIIVLNSTPDGNFAHNPEPLKENLTNLIETVKNKKFDLGIAVDPDVDRLVLVSENGDLFGEEYTLVAAVDTYLDYEKTPVVSNMSSSMALRDLAKERKVPYFSSKVGELYVVEQMKINKAKIGGEGNGGVIVGDFHYGRDALVGIAMIINKLDKENISLSTLKKRYTFYEMVKDKVSLKGLSKNILFESFKNYHTKAEIDLRDGIKAIYTNSWIHLRLSNTEPIMRIYAEAKTYTEALVLVADTKKALSLL